MMPEEISIPDFYELLESERDDFFLFDVRNADEFEKWHIEGRRAIPTLNIPYYDIVEQGGKEDFKESIASYAAANLASKLPKEKKIVVVCSKGGASSIIAGTLKTLGYNAISLSGGMKKWVDYYLVKPIIDSIDLSIYQIIRPAKGCLSYLIASDKNGTVIDPSKDIQLYVNLFKEKEIQPQFILDTHAHADHVSGGKKLADQLGVPYYLHPYDGIHPIDMLPAKYTYTPSWTNKKYLVGKAELTALHIPGHTLGNQAFLLNRHYLFTGDSIFIRSISRPDLGGQVKTWTQLHFESLRNLLQLPNDTMILPGHFSTLQEMNPHGFFTSSLGELKQQNEGVMMAQKSFEEFNKYILSNLPEFPNEYTEIKRVNIGLKEADDEYASELEHGKNICAISHQNKE